MKAQGHVKSVADAKGNLGWGKQKLTCILCGAVAV